MRSAVSCPCLRYKLGGGRFVGTWTPKYVTHVVAPLKENSGMVTATHMSVGMVSLQQWQCALTVITGMLGFLPC